MRITRALAMLAILLPIAAQAATVPPIVGAWRLVEIIETESDGRIVRHADLKGSLIYTADGRLSVQVAYPDETVNSPYARNGYEASFGRYTIDAKSHRLVHYVEGANVRALVGKDVLRAYRVEGRRLLIGPVSPSEHWSVVWERQ